jgi:hypothetical protein
MLPTMLLTELTSTYKTSAVGNVVSTWRKHEICVFPDSTDLEIPEYHDLTFCSRIPAQVLTTYVILIEDDRLPDTLVVSEDHVGELGEDLLVPRHLGSRDFRHMFQNIKRRTPVYLSIVCI